MAEISFSSAIDLIAFTYFGYSLVILALSRVVRHSVKRTPLSRRSPT